MRLWAVQLTIIYQRGSVLIAEPQIIIEADTPEEAQAIAKQWFRASEEFSIPSPVEVGVRTVEGIDLENIWIFNDDRFRATETPRYVAPGDTYLEVAQQSDQDHDRDRHAQQQE
jgi:hypothetical protein